MLGRREFDMTCMEGYGSCMHSADGSIAMKWQRVKYGRFPQPPITHLRLDKSPNDEAQTRDSHFTKRNPTVFKDHSLHHEPMIRPN